MGAGARAGASRSQTPRARRDAAACTTDALIGSSTSGLLPLELQAGVAHPERLFVAHPYNPVYLLPLVEIVGGAATTAATIDRARAVLDTIGMKDVVIAREIEAFVGDRLLEALWRDALWLIKHDISDVETLDDVIRYSLGLGWAQMGLFHLPDCRRRGWHAPFPRPVRPCLKGHGLSSPTSSTSTRISSKRSQLSRTSRRLGIARRESFKCGSNDYCGD